MLIPANNTIKDVCQREIAMEVGDKELMIIDNREVRDLGHGAPKVRAHPQRWRQEDQDFKVILDYTRSYPELHGTRKKTTLTINNNM